MALDPSHTLFQKPRRVFPSLSARLELEDGTVFSGTSFGAPVSRAGETVFCTGMVGYEHSLTDPSFCGQLLAFTYPLIGNYGVSPESQKDKLAEFFESDRVQAAGVIVQEACKKPSHWNSRQTLSDWLDQNNVAGIEGVDTRALTTHLRTHGSMLGRIVVEKKEVDWFDPNRTNLVEQVSTKRVEHFGSGKTRVALIDCGAKNNIVRSLLARGLSVAKVPWNYDLLNADFEFDGVMASNGPGDPTKCAKTVQTIRSALEQKKPFFGICLGNQLLALAIGAKTYKLKFGHRSQNQPVVLTGENRGFVTSQNHGFAVDAKTLPRGWAEWFSNLNDQSNEGIFCKKQFACSVQFHPEAIPGPVDTAFLFDEFKQVLRR